MAAIARTFHHFQSVAFELERGGAALLDGDIRALRVSVTIPGEEELERVVQIPEGRDDQARAAEAAIRRTLAEAGVLDDPQLSLAILAQTIRGLLSRQTGAAENETFGPQRTFVEGPDSTETRLGGK